MRRKEKRDKSGTQKVSEGLGLLGCGRRTKGTLLLGGGNLHWQKIMLLKHAQSVLKYQYSSTDKYLSSIKKYVSSRSKRKEITNE
eukprot:scaffold3083_cov126-Skeletonema_marinoi.AAC.4